jgi:competence CoiA-like predicted nuclease
MLYAINKITGEIQSPYKGMEALCPDCKEDIRPKCGTINIWHFAHKNFNPLKHDVWQERETEWHRQWKKEFPKEWCEKKIENHRADILRPMDNIVIEFQNSPLSCAEIWEREKFYKKMIWVLNLQKIYEKGKFEYHNNDWIPYLGYVGEKMPYHKFYWKWHKRSWRFTRNSVWLDLGNNKIFECKKINTNGAGWGHLWNTDSFIKELLSP